MATYTGGIGHDDFHGIRSGDYILGGAGNDTLIGEGSNDRIAGGDGDDYLDGGDGNDFLDGGSGRDVLRGGGGNDFLNGGLGVDAAVYAGFSGDFEISLTEDGWSVSDRPHGNAIEGRDRLSGVERLRFLDKTVYLVPDIAPIAAGDAASVTEDGSISEAASVLANDSDPDGDPITVTAVAGQALSGTPVYLPSGASILMHPDGTYTFETNGAFEHLSSGQSEQVEISYQVSDGEGGNTTGTLAITVTGVDDDVSPQVHVAGQDGLRHDGTIIVPLAGGDRLLVWQSYHDGFNGWDLLSQRVAADGSILGQPQVATNQTFNDQVHPSAIALNDGGYVLTWSGSSIGYGVWAQRYDGQGAKVGPEVRLSDGARQTIISIDDTHYVASWSKYDPAFQNIVTVWQVFDLDGNASSTLHVANTTSASMMTDYGTSVAQLAGGQIVIAWIGTPDGQVHARLFSLEGDPLTDVLQVNVGQTSLISFDPSIAALTGGGFAIAWETGGGSDGDGHGVFGRVFDAVGSPTTGQFLVNTVTEANQLLPDVVELSDGGFTVYWESWLGQQSIEGQRFDAHGARVGSEYQFASVFDDGSHPPSAHPFAMNDGNGEILIVWANDGSVSWAQYPDTLVFGIF